MSPGGTGLGGWKRSAEGDFVTAEVTATCTPARARNEFSPRKSSFACTILHVFWGFCSSESSLVMHDVICVLTHFLPRESFTVIILRGHGKEEKQSVFSLLCNRKLPHFPCRSPTTGPGDCITQFLSGSLCPGMFLGEVTWTQTLRWR